MDESDFRYLFDLSAVIGAAQAHIRDRDEKIVSLLRYKRATVAHIANATGLTKSQICQIVEAAKLGQRIGLSMSAKSSFSISGLERC